MRRSFSVVVGFALQSSLVVVCFVLRPSVLNNFVPLVILALLSNMDCQAALSKDAVIEYMTKCMTKYGHGVLIKVMENSFALCIEKARENKQGTGFAMLRWFNLQSITEVKSQLESMHLMFAVPR